MKDIGLADVETLPGEEDASHENIPAALPEKAAVKQLISESSDLMGRLQKPKAKRSKTDSQPENLIPATSSKAESSNKAKTVVLEEALEFEVRFHLRENNNAKDEHLHDDTLSSLFC